MTPDNTLPPLHSTIRSRQLGLRLRSVMTDAGWNGKRIADWLGQSQSSISRMLTGHRLPSIEEISAFLAVCHVTGDLRDELMAQCAESPTPDLFQVHGEPRWAAFREHAGQAHHITEFAPVMVPWIAQVSGYTRAVTASLGSTTDEADAWLGFRLRVTDLVGQTTRPNVNLLLHESVLHTPVCGPDVMSDQLHRLLQLSVIPTVCLRIVPMAIGAHAGMTGGFTLLEFAAFPPAVYHEDIHASVFIETPTAIDRCRWTIQQLTRAALDVEESRDLLRDLAVELYGPTEPTNQPITHSTAQEALYQL